MKRLRSMAVGVGGLTAWAEQAARGRRWRRGGGSGRGARAGGFTLIELLVCISIIALLIALLMPALASARRTAKASHCLANQRQIGQAALVHVVDRSGRLPGRAQNFRQGSSSGTSVSWRDHVFIGQYMEVSVNELRCTEWPEWGSGRWIVLNNWATGRSNIHVASGGQSLGSNGARQNDGLEVPAPWSGVMMLGAQYERFRNPAHSVLTREYQRGADYGDARGGANGNANYPGGAVRLDEDGIRSVDGPGMYAFRHAQTTAMFLFVDGHAARISADTPRLAVNDRYNFDGR